MRAEDDTDDAAVIHSGIAPWLRPASVVAAGAATFLLPFLITALTSATALALPLILAVMLVSWFSAWFASTGKIGPAQVLVGSDGISVRWMGVERFHTYENLDVALAVGGGPEEEVYKRFPSEAVLLTYKDGRKVKFGVPRADHMKVANDVNRRLDAYKNRSSSEPARLTLKRGEREFGEWIATLDREPEDAYRTHLNREQLLAVLRDPTSPATARVAAAKLLRARVEDRARIRVVAEQTAQPRVRVALEHAASNEDEMAVNRSVAKVKD